MRWIRQPRQLLIAWVPPVMLALAILVGVHSRVTADPAPSSAELQAYLQQNQLNVYEATAGSYPQIFYTYNHQHIQLTTDDYIHLHPISDGQYVAWVAIVDGQSQVFLDDVLSGSVLQLSLVSPNEGLQLYHNQLVWQGWDGQNWQIFYYDGSQVEQITNDSVSSFNAATNGSQVLYAQQLSADDWVAKSYDISSGQTATIREGDTVSTAYPSFNSDGTISTAFVPR